MPKLQTNGAKQKQTTYMILLLWAAVCFALLVVDWCCWAPNRLDADMASEQLLANLLAQEGGVMSTNWYYSTELRVLNTQLVMAPLFRLFTSWHTVRVVGSVVLILLYLAAWFWFGRSAKLKYSGLLGAGLLVLPYGALYRQYVLEGLYYIPHIAISFVVLGCAVRILRGGRRLAPAAGMVLFSFAAALGGPRQLFILNIPLTVAAALLCWLDAPPADTLRQKLANAWRTPGGDAAGAHPCGGCCRAGGVPGQRKGAGGKISLPGPGVCGLYRAEPGPPAMVCKCAAGFLWLAGGQSVFSGRAV